MTQISNIIQVEYKKDLETTKGHSINYCETPQFKNVSKIAKYTSDVSASSVMAKNDSLFYIYAVTVLGTCVQSCASSLSLFVFAE